MNILNGLSTQSHVYTVSQLNAEARLLMEERFRVIWISGEISNLSQPHSGHLYFSLKDAAAQVRCALFRQHGNQVGIKLQNGQQVLLKAQVSLYEARGDFQLIVTQVHLTGDGALQIAFEKLKKRLYEAGLFSETHKKPIPLFPSCIGIITSPSGAALRDILKVLKRRFPMIPIIVYPTLVQGEKAAPQIGEALQCAAEREECDVLLLARGGGSLEDLWPFNEEIVAHAIFNCPIPIVTGIGHEIDYTIADFVADQRAPTPSAAAEQISPSQDEWKQRLQAQQKHLYRLMSTQLHRLQNQLQHLKKQLRHPGRRLQDQAQQLDQLEMGLLKTMTHILQRKQMNLSHLKIRCLSATPENGIHQKKILCETLHHRLLTTTQHVLYRCQQQVALLAKALETVSPLTTLNRGYAIITHHNRVIKNAHTLRKNDKIIARLAEGQLHCRVEEIE